MKCVIPEISWHNRDPVLSVDIQPSKNGFYRLASGGGDCHVVIWLLKVLESGSTDIEAVSDLTRHQRAVNVVRWSHSGQYLASGDDDANIIIWQIKTDNAPNLDGNTSDKETWVVHKVLRGHKEDVYDICWSPDDTKLLSGSIDNTAIIWDFAKGKIEKILSDHKGFVQGVTWDPKNEYISTACSDRKVRMYRTTGKLRSRTGNGLLPVPESHPLFGKEVKYFHDDTFKSYFRRLQFSPDGSLLIVPAGCIETDECKKALTASFIFTLDNLKEPAAIIPSEKQCSVCVRFCPLLFELRPNGPKPLVSLPYRMIFAIGTDTDVMIYDTQQSKPVAYLKKIHYTRLTDICWSQDGLILIASSTDGFCTVVNFKEGELGTVYTKKIEESVQEDLHNDLKKSEMSGETKPKKPEIKKRPTILEQWTIKTPKKPSEINDMNGKIKCNTIEIPMKAPEVNTSILSPPVNKLTPRRIQPIQIQGNKKCIGNTSTPNKGNLVTTVEKRKENETSEFINADEEAQDAWKCKNNEEKTDSMEDVTVDEDFKLEYSYPETPEVCNKDVTPEVCKQNGTPEILPIAKKPRRVELIHLSCPKNKN